MRRQRGGHVDDDNVDASRSEGKEDSDGGVVEPLTITTAEKEKEAESESKTEKEEDISLLNELNELSDLLDTLDEK
jgi:hypothetical protein